MVELSTLLEKTPPDKKLDSISNDDLLVVEVNVDACIACDMERILQRVGGGGLVLACLSRRVQRGRPGTGGSAVAEVGRGES